jgi:hypothetical protein
VGIFQAAGKHGHEVLFNTFASTEHRLLDVDEIAVLGKPHGLGVSALRANRTAEGQGAWILVFIF